MLQEFNDCRAILRAQLVARQQRNPSYSLRAFARDLALSPSRLCEVMGDVPAGLSVATADKIAERMQLGEREHQYFVDLAILNHSRSSLRRSLAQSRIESYRETPAYNQMSAEDFDFIANWYHLAIVELTQLADFQPQTEWIAKKLALTETQVVTALTRLEEVGLVRFDDDDTLVVVKERNAVASTSPSESIRSFHRQMLGKALVAVDEQSQAERDLGATILAFDSSKVAQVKALLREMRQDFVADVKEISERPDALYGLCIQWFKVTD